MKKNKYKCLECKKEIEGKFDGFKCPECNGELVPIIKTNKDKDELQNNNIVVLRKQSISYNDATIEELEKKYSTKFGCKVIILEAGLEMVEFING